MTLRAQDPAAPVLTPKLTAWDRRVLDTLPTVPRWPRSEWAGISVWQVAEALRTFNVADVDRTLNGLVRMRHAIEGESRSRRLHAYARMEAE